MLKVSDSVAQKSQAMGGADGSATGARRNVLIVQEDEDDDTNNQATGTGFVYI